MRRAATLPIPASHDSGEARLADFNTHNLARCTVEATAEQPIHFANATLGTERHICAFFHSPEEEYCVLLPFIREGIERGEKGFHIVDPQLMEDHLARLRRAGVDADGAQS